MSSESYKKYELSELVNTGYVVAIEGDFDLYDDELAEWLHKYCKNYKLINNIYDNPSKLLELKDIEVDVFIVQTTGLHPDLPKLIDFYIEKIGNYPKHFITFFREGHQIFWKILKEMDSCQVYRYQEVVDDKMYVVRQDHACK